MAKSCTSVASSRIKKVFVVLEDVSGTLQRPVSSGFVMPAGDVTMNQTPQYTDSEELSGTLDVIDQFKNALEAGEISLPMYVRLEKDGKIQGQNLFTSLMGSVQERGAVTATVAAAGATDPAGIDAATTTIPYDGLATGVTLPATGTVAIDAEKISYAGLTASTLTGCTRGANNTTAAAHADDAVITLTVAGTVATAATDTDTEIAYAVADVSNVFPTAGTITIGTEEITYTGIESDKFTGCTRGANGTTAAAHEANDAISLTITFALNKPEQALTGTVPATATEIPIEGVSGGVMPRRGVVEIGGEKIRYTDVTMTSSDEVTALKGCTRGFAGTTAAEIADAAAITLTSRVFMWDNCRPSASVWLQIDHSVFFASGAVVTQCQLPMNKSGGQHADFTLQFRKMGWAGRSYLNETPTSGTLSVATSKGTAAAQGYSVGAIVQNSTRADDNNGAGYTVTAVDETNGTITVSPAPSGWAKDDRIDPWLPAGEEVGTPLESADLRVFVGGVTGKLTEGNITLGTPTAFASEIGDEYPGENADNLRQLTMDNGIYFRAEDIIEFKRGYDGYDLRVDVVLGNKAGTTLSLAMPRVRFQMPSMATQEPFVTLTRTGAIMGTKGNDSLYLIQE